MAKHPAGPFTVLVRAYSLEAGRVGADRHCIYHSRHRSPHGAARRLASIIAGKSQLARDCRAAAPRQGLQMVITGGDGTARALNAHRATFGKVSS